MSTRTGPGRPVEAMWKRGGDRAGDVLGAGDEEAVLGDRHRDAADVGLLEGVRPDRRGGDLAGDGDDRHRVHVGVGDRRDEVRGARAGRRHADADLAGRDARSPRRRGPRPARGAPGCGARWSRRAGRTRGGWRRPGCRRRPPPRRSRATRRGPRLQSARVRRSLSWTSRVSPSCSAGLVVRAGGPGGCYAGATDALAARRGVNDAGQQKTPAARRQTRERRRARWAQPTRVRTRRCCMGQASAPPAPASTHGRGRPDIRKDARRP